jgi:hypothetical protein
MTPRSRRERLRMLKLDLKLWSALPCIIAVNFSSGLNSPTEFAGLTQDAPPRKYAVGALPEILQHLEAAKSGLIDPDRALAHAQLVLIGDQVTYYCHFCGAAARERTRCLAALSRVLSGWSQALGNTLAFRQVSQPSQANMVIKFQERVLDGSEQVAGYSSWNRVLVTENRRTKAAFFRSTLRIGTQDLTGSTMNESGLRHTISHEVGHILGLDDSDLIGLLMGPLDIDHPVGGPTSAEVDLVVRIRREARQIQAEARYKVKAPEARP